MSITLEQVLGLPLHCILAWSQDRPLWQRDALRRIVLSGELSQPDLDELYAICKSQRDLASDGIPTPAAEPLSLDHIPPVTDVGASVSLVKLGSLKNVNRLPSDQVVEFGPAPGLTVIYGENGSGKSGYARVIKKACRARGTAPAIMSNAFNQPATGPATAEIVCSTGAAEIQITWTDGIPCDPRLTNVFVFDAVSARFYATDDAPAAFIPSGLDVLPKLARACDEFSKRRIKAEIESLVATMTQAKNNWKYNPQTVVGKLLDNLDHATENAEIEKAADFPVDAQKRLTEIADALRSDPKQNAQATNSAAARIREFASQVAIRSEALSDSLIGSIRQAFTNAAEARTIVAVTGGPKFDDTFLPGTGGDAWRQLWDIARAFSTEAYPSSVFPVTDPDSRCVLCQQALDADAKIRFVQFDTYVRDEARTRVQTALHKIAELKEERDLLPVLDPELAKISSDLAAEPIEVRTAIESYVKEADAQNVRVQSNFLENAWTDLPSIAPAPTSILASIGTALEKRAQMELSADNPDQRNKLVAEQAELQDIEWLARNKKAVLGQVANHKKVALLKKCLEDTTTNNITIKNGQLHDALVTKAFCESFSNERDLLGLKTLPVKLTSVKGEKGERRFGTRLDTATSIKIRDVASEGEHGCIALAAFLAELSQASHKSALVFDDPASSLDHKRRASIAERLVVESKARQVIVFTHDLAFLCDLQVYSDEHGVEIHGRHLDWSSTGPGRCHGELPWEGQKHKAQMKTLREQCGRAARISREEGQEEYRVFARGVCDQIRAAAERIVEEELFNHVLRRHESRIQVGRLESVAAVDSSDYKAVHVVWKACSEVTPAHSSSRARPPEIPDPTKLKEYVDSLEKTVEAVKQRRKGS